MSRAHEAPRLSWITAWIGVSVATFFGQLILGTGILFAMLSLAIFLMLPVVFNAYGHLDNLGGLVLLATFGKLFLVSQWLKILFLQAADTNLDSPDQTALLLLLGLISFWLAALVMMPILAHRRGLIRIPQDPAFLVHVAVMAFGLTLFALAVRFNLGLGKLGDAEYTEGRGLAILSYLAQLLPLAVAALTARAAIVSRGRRFLDVFVLLALGATVFQGIWENQRTSMMAGFVAFACTYVSYGGRVRARHVLMAVVAGIAMQFVIFPLIDVQRSFSSDMSVREFLDQTSSVAADMLDPEARAAYEQRLESVYLSWETRLYYGEPQGFLDRFAPNPLDETITLFNDQPFYGVSYLAAQAGHVVPNLILQPLGLERPVRGGERLETDVFGRYTSMNYGVFAEVFASVGYLFFVPACVFILVFYFTGLHMLYGSFRYNYFAAYAVSTSYFTFATSDLADILPQVTIQGILNFLLFVGMVALSGRLSTALASGRRL